MLLPLHMLAPGLLAGGAQPSPAPAPTGGGGGAHALRKVRRIDDELMLTAYWAFAGGLITEEEFAILAAASEDVLN